MISVTPQLERESSSHLKNLPCMSSNPLGACTISPQRFKPILEYSRYDIWALELCVPEILYFESFVLQIVNVSWGSLHMSSRLR